MGLALLGGRKLGNSSWSLGLGVRVLDPPWSEILEGSRQPRQVRDSTQHLFLMDVCLSVQVHVENNLGCHP